MSLYTGEGSFNNKKTVSRPSQDLKQISVIVPKDFDEQKRNLGVSWRVLIARGLQHSDDSSIKQQLEHFINVATKYHQENRELRQRILKLEMGDSVEKD